MKKEFEKVLKDCEDKFNSKKEKYGDSWKDMSDRDLYARMFQEIEELQWSDNFEEAYGEVLDVINCGIMFCAKLNSKKAKIIK